MYPCVRSQPHAVASASPAFKSAMAVTFSCEGSLLLFFAIICCCSISNDLKLSCTALEEKIYLLRINCAPEYPIAQRILPQFASCPAIAAFVRFEHTTDFARTFCLLFCLCSDNLYFKSAVAPSPSPAIAFASVSFT